MAKRIRTKEEQLRYVQKLVDIADEHYFHDFFLDKNLKISIVNMEEASHYLDRCDPTWEAYACLDCFEIGINRELFEKLAESDMDDWERERYIYDVILHEMIHLFVGCATPNGRRVWGDRCKAFRELERSFCLYH